MSICKLPKGSRLLFGSGGSNTIIAITPKKEVFKYFPLIITPDTSKKQIMEQKNFFKREIHILKSLTRDIIDENKSPHIVRINKSHYCKDVPTSFFKNCEKYSKFLMQKTPPSKQCDYIYRHYPNILGAGMYICDLEYCSASLSDAIALMIKKPITQIKTFLDVTLFQITFTLEMIKHSYPYFTHYDLFIRNILLSNEHYEKGKYIRYTFGPSRSSSEPSSPRSCVASDRVSSGNLSPRCRIKVFDVPADNVFIKINDFGLTQLDKKTLTEFTPIQTLIHNPRRDYFNILWDLYNGGNLGSQSLSSLTKNENKQKFLKKYFSQFMSIKTLDKIVKNNKKQYIDWNWNNALDPQFSSLVKLATPQQMLTYFADIFPMDPKHDISEEYGI